MVVALPPALFPYTVNQKFWLVALPNLIGAVMRLPYTFAVTRLGGRTWTAISALLLLIPIVGLMFAVTVRPPYWVVLLCAASAGFGGGNFASSMTNISFFYPERKKGTALGINAAGGNVGISTMQLFVPIVLAAGLVYGGLMWLPLVLAAAVCAYLFMNDLAVARTPFRDQFATVKRLHTWIMSFLYIGTFGSFLGYSAAFPLLLKLQFPLAPVGHVGAATITLAFAGPLIGSIARPIGGWLSDKVGGARVTAACFVLMGIGSYGVVSAVGAKSLPLFLGLVRAAVHRRRCGQRLDVPDDPGHLRGHVARCRHRQARVGRDTWYRRRHRRPRRLLPAAGDQRLLHRDGWDRDRVHLVHCDVRRVPGRDVVVLSAPSRARVPNRKPGPRDRVNTA